MAKTGESRRGRRVGVALPALLAYGNDQLATRTENVSLLGSYVHVEREIPIGTAVNVTLDLPPTSGGGSAQCQGIVVRCESIGPALYGLGLFFNQFLGESEAKLDHLIDELLKKQTEEATRYFEERERLRKERLKKKLEEKRKKRRKRGRPRKKRTSRASRKTSN